MSIEAGSLLRKKEALFERSSDIGLPTKWLDLGVLTCLLQDFAQSL
jgi:hypothetical protein